MLYDLFFDAISNVRLCGTIVYKVDQENSWGTNKLFDKRDWMVW